MLSNNFKIFIFTGGGSCLRTLSVNLDRHLPRLQRNFDPAAIGVERFRSELRRKLLAGLAASLGAVTNPIGSILSGVLAEYAGRKISILISSIPFLVGWLCMATANDISLLYAGRLITGIAAGMSTASYTYVAEISTAEDRGFLQSLGPIAASFGILLTYTLGSYFKWNIVALVSVVFAAFTMISIQLVPESPGYLLKKSKKEEAFKSLVWFRKSNALAQLEIDKFDAHLKVERVSIKELFMSTSIIKPFFILITLFLLQELSGIYTILFYAVDFFQNADLDIDEHISSIIVGIIRLLMSIVASVLLNKYGRKTLCMISSSGMALSIFIPMAYFRYYEIFTDLDKSFSVVPLIGILLNVFFSMVGMLPIPWILVSELFPLRVRPIMGGFVICLAQCFIFICVKIYYDLIEYLNFSGTLFTFFFASVITTLFCKYVLPETKDKNLEDIEKYFRKHEDTTIYTISNDSSRV
ncbi:hypothetical protein FQA39_LY16894 [Lamprigera yunnana]|nr:hypothetical protein FQA39_LY16894 [Lamprigera yunnana]